MASGTVVVRGLKELTRDFKRISKDLDKEVVDGLVEASDDVKRDAESLALGRIRNMTQHWSQMRIGVSRAQGMVYMVPLARGRGQIHRGNLKTLLLERSMDPALERNSDTVEKKLDAVLGKLAGDNGFH